MRYFILTLCLTCVLSSANDDLGLFLQAYTAKDMDLACEKGRSLYRANIRDESILIAAGHACSAVDYIDFVGVLQQRLGFSEESRKAAVYFSTLVLKKRLISQYMHEGTDLKLYTLPNTDHILSRVYEGIRNEKFTLVSVQPKHLRIGNDKDYIDIFVKKKIHVDVYQNGQKIQEHRYR